MNETEVGIEDLPTSLNIWKYLDVPTRNNALVQMGGVGPCNADLAVNVQFEMQGRVSANAAKSGCSDLHNPRTDLRRQFERFRSGCLF
jgi:hypothetical protein